MQFGIITAVDFRSDSEFPGSQGKKISRLDYLILVGGKHISIMRTNLKMNLL